MIKLILVRHGKTTCNEKGALSGLTDSVLSETGKLQSQKIADYLKYTNIDKIYTTPFKRTKETIEKLAETKNIKVEESSQLNEINFGDFEGLSFKDIEKNHPEEVQKMIKDGDKYKYPNGESLEDTFVRVKKEIDNIINGKKKKKVEPKFTGKIKKNTYSKYKDKFSNDDEFDSLIDKLLEDYFNNF